MIAWDRSRELISDQLKETPEISNNTIAGQLGVDDKTVAAVRKDMEATSEIPKLTSTTGKDGKKRRKPIRTAFVDDSPEGEKEALAVAKTIRAKTNIYSAPVGTACPLG